MIPEHRMATLFHQFKDSKIRECIYHNTREVPSLYMDHSCNRSSFPLELHTELDQHSHEVWFCAFSNDGTRLATASKDKSVIIYDTTAFRVKHVLREHRQPVAYVAWSPDDSRLVSCSQDFEARLWDTKVCATLNLIRSQSNAMCLQSGRCVRILKHHMEPVSTAAWAPDGKSFVTGSLDLQRPLCVWPSESASSNSSPLHTFDNCSRVEGCAIATLRPESPSALLAEDDGSNSSETNNSVRLVAFCTDKTVHVFDYARREKLRHIVLDWAITCISLSKDGHEMLMNLNCGQIWTVGVEDGAVRQKYWGQRQGNFMIRSCFGGATESFIVSGGEGQSHVVCEARLQYTDGHEQMAGYASGIDIQVACWRTWRDTGQRVSTPSTGTRPTQTCSRRSATTAKSGCKLTQPLLLSMPESNVHKMGDSTPRPVPSAGP